MDIRELFSPVKALEIRRKALKTAVDKAERYDPNYKVGLDFVQVEERKKNLLVNKKKKVVTKTYFRIFTDNFFSFFNILIFGLAIIAGVAQKYNQLMFLGVILVNCAIGIYQDIHARHLVDRLSIINKMTSKVVRMGVQSQISANELVLDDVIYLENGDQIPADCILLNGKCSVNEAMLTGEPDAVKKKVGSTLLSGTYVSSGTCYARVNNIGSLNAAEEIQAKASAFNKPKSEILRSLNFLFRIIGFIVIIVGILSIISYWYIDPKNFDWATFAGKPNDNNSGYVGSFVGTLVAMIPAGLFLLTSTALSVGVINLSKKRCLVQELYSIEMLARVDTLCLDKTGTITDGTMLFNDYIKIDKKFEVDKAGQIIRSIIAATKDDSYTTKALLSQFGRYTIVQAKTSAPFSSETKCSGATFDHYGTFAMGAFGYLKITNEKVVKPIVNEYSRKGYRCLILGTCKKPIIGDKIPEEMTCIGVIVLEDHIRETAPNTLKWFAGNGVDVKVISGDDPITVSEIAYKAGIQNSESYINLQGMSVEQVKQIANNYAIFGRVSPEQKEALVVALKDAGKTVGMTGDGVNDILALKRSDCSIAMNSGSDAAKNVSHLVLLDSDFSVLPSVVSEGRRVINNLQRTSSLFLSKTIFTMILSVLAIIMTFSLRDPNMIFPLQTNNFYVWEIACIGVGGFFLSLEPNASQIEGHFLSNAIKRALPISIALFLTTFIYFIIFIIDNSMGGHVIFSLNANCTTKQTYQAMCSIAMCVIGFFSFYRICMPFTKYRVFVFVILLILTVVGLIATFSIKIKDINGNMIPFGSFWFAFDFTSFSLIDWVWSAAILEAGGFFYVLLDKRFEKLNLFKKFYMSKLEREQYERERKN